MCIRFSVPFSKEKSGNLSASTFYSNTTVSSVKSNNSYSLIKIIQSKKSRSMTHYFLKIIIRTIKYMTRYIFECKIVDELIY